MKFKNTLLTLIITLITPLFLLAGGGGEAIGGLKKHIDVHPWAIDGFTGTSTGHMVALILFGLILFSFTRLYKKEISTDTPLDWFLGNSPPWFKQFIIHSLIANIVICVCISPVLCSWIVIGEFIFTLAMALKCYPLQSGGLYAIQVLIMQLTHTNNVYNEVVMNLEVVLLLVFMVAAIFFMKPLLMFIFSKLFTRVKSKFWLSVFIVSIAALLSAFLDALTVTAVIISVFSGFYNVYHKIQSSNKDLNKDGVLDRKQMSGDTLDQFRAFLTDLAMHALIGTALGGVSTLVGEPQNLLIGERLGWDFIEFAIKVSPVSIATFFAGIATTMLLEATGLFGYGNKMPDVVRDILNNYVDEENTKLRKNRKAKYNLIIQGFCAFLLILGLGLHIAPVGFLGVFLIIIQTALMGKIEEHDLGPAFEEGLPFTTLLVVFFIIVAMIHDQHLFGPMIAWALSFAGEDQITIFFGSTAILSMISDNVFVATVFISEVQKAFDGGFITFEQYENIAVAINVGTNIPSVATPNGQAAFLFLLTSALSPLILLSYGKMVWKALPYTIILTITAGIALMVRFGVPSFITNLF